MNASMMKVVRSVLALAVLLIVSPAWAWPPLWLTPGTWGAVSGTTAAQLPELAGVVVYDRVRPFEIRDAAGILLFEGSLQDRVVRSTATGDLHFYYRVRDTNPALFGNLAIVDTRDFSGLFGVHVDYRPDGLGTEAPSRAVRSGDGALVRFVFWPNPISGGEASRFCFVKPLGIDEFMEGGLVTLRLITGESVGLPVMMPVPP